MGLEGELGGQEVGLGGGERPPLVAIGWRSGGPVYPSMRVINRGGPCIYHERHRTWETHGRAKQRPLAGVGMLTGKCPGEASQVVVGVMAAPPETGGLCLHGAVPSHEGYGGPAASETSLDGAPHPWVRM